MEQYRHFIFIAVAFSAFFTLIAFGSYFWSYRKNKNDFTKYRSLNVFSTCLIFLTFICGQVLLFPTNSSSYRWAYSLAPQWMDGKGYIILNCLLGVLLFDLIFYLWHRFSHNHKFFWMGHQIHHQDNSYNMMLNYRDGVLEGLLLKPFLMSFILMGFHPVFLTSGQSIVTTFMMMLHTNIPRLPKPIELIFNTPANHRKHHEMGAMSGRCNYGGITMIWDHLFSTYNAQGEPTQFGVKGVSNDLRPFSQQIRGLWGRFTDHSIAFENAAQFSYMQILLLLLSCLFTCFALATTHRYYTAVSFILLVAFIDYYPKRPSLRNLFWLYWGIFTGHTIYESIQFFKNGPPYNGFFMTIKLSVVLLAFLAVFRDKGIKEVVGEQGLEPRIRRL